MPNQHPAMSVTSFSLREQLGPIEFRFRDPSGVEQKFELDYPQELTISEFPRRAADYFGIDVVETVGFQFDGLDDPEVDRFGAALRESGVGLLNIALDIGDLASSDAELRAIDVAEHRRWIERFAAMGSTYVRVNPGSPFTPHRGDPPAPHLVEALVDLGAYATSQGTRLLVENHVGPSSDPAWLSTLLDAVGRDACGLLLDLGNFEALLGPLRSLSRQDREPTEVEFAALKESLDLTSLYGGIETLAPYAEMISVKEHVVEEDGTIGFVDLERAMGTILAHGFDGAWSVEYEGVGGDPWRKSLRILEATRDIVRTAQAKS
jgi:sugar phosphate isomerase/epimerase